MAAPGGILALDIATRTGWAYAGPDQVAAWPDVPLAARAHPRPRWGLIDISSAGAGAGRWTRYVDRLTDLLSLTKPAVIVYEAPLSSVGMPNAHTAVILHGLVAFTEYTAARWRIVHRPAHISTVRKHFLGRAPRDGRAKAKAAVIDGCARRGWDISNDNIADALAVLDYAIADARARRAAA